MAEQSFSVGASQFRTSAEDTDYVQWLHAVIPDTQFDNAFKVNAADDRYFTFLLIGDHTNEHRIALDVGATATEDGTHNRDLSTTFEQNWEIEVSHGGSTWLFTHDNFDADSDSAERYVWFAANTTTENLIDDLVDNTPAGTSATITFRDGPAAQLPLPTAPSVTIDAIAAGDESTAVTLTATLAGGGYDSLTYDWDVSGGLLDDDTLASPTWTRPSVPADRDYFVNLTLTANGDGTNYRSGESVVVTAAQVTATVRDTAQLPLPTAPTTVAISSVPAGDEGTTVQLSATVNGGNYDSGPTYAWTVSGGQLDDATLASPTWTRPSVASDSTHTVDLTVTVAGDGTSYRNGEEASASATQVSSTVRDIGTLLPLPTAPTSVVISAVGAGNEGTSVTLSATVNGGAYDALDYAWSVGGGALSNAFATSPTWTRPGVSVDSSYSIDLTVTARGTGSSYRNNQSVTRSATTVFSTVRNTTVAVSVNYPNIPYSASFRPETGGRITEIAGDGTPRIQDWDGETAWTATLTGDLDADDLATLRTFLRNNHGNQVRFPVGGDSFLGVFISREPSIVHRGPISRVSVKLSAVVE